MVNKTDISFNIYSDLKINIKGSLSMKIKSLYRVLTAANEFYQRCALVEPVKQMFATVP